MSGKEREGDGYKSPEVVIASEKVQVQNIKAVIEYAQETRRIVRALDERIITLKNIILTQSGTIENVQKQMAALQQKIYAGGTGE